MRFSTLLAGIVLSAFTLSAQADDIEDIIEVVGATNRTLAVQGITFEVTDRTDYDDGLRRFEDLREGQRVDVDFVYRDGRHIATEIELEH